MIRFDAGPHGRGTAGFEVFEHAWRHLGRLGQVG